MLLSTSFSMLRVRAPWFAPAWLVSVLSLLALSAQAQPSAPRTQTGLPDVVWEQPAGASTVVFSDDGQYVASGGVESVNPFSFGRVDVFDADDGTALAHRETHGAGVIGFTNEVTISPGGQRLASANGTVYCAPKGGCSADRPGLFTWTFPDLDPVEGRSDLTPAASLNYAPDGEALAVAYFYDNQGFVRVHDPASLGVEQTLAGHGTEAAGVRYSPDGTRLASVGNASLSEGTLKVWDATTGMLVYTVEHGEYLDGGVPTSVAYSPDGSLIATTGFGYGLRAKVWDAATGTLLLDLDALIPNAVDGSAVVAFTPNGKYLVGGFQQYVSGTGQYRGLIRFWDVETGAVVLEYDEVGPPPYFGGVTAIAFSPAQDHRFAYTAYGRVKVAETTLSLSNPVAAVSVVVEPAAPPVTIPAGGGLFDFTLTLTNTTATAQTFDLWTALTGPASRDPLFGPRQVTIQPGAVVARTLTQRVPANAPGGVYTYTANVGTFGSAVTASSHFSFTKQPALGTSAREIPDAAWVVSGWDEPLATEAAAALVMMEGASPNPFTAHTTIRFTASEATAMRLAVYDVLGREVAVLVDGVYAAGQHEALFDGSRLPSGTYLMRLEAGATVQTQRLTLVR